jgi:oxygen-independent coproporphyrinogen-3 oxidase
LHKCGYCDFNSHNIDVDEMSAYVSALTKEMRHTANLMQTTKRPVETIFLGGGTPTTLPIPLLEKIFAACADCFQLDPTAEITIEANPATIETGFLEELRNLGPNRISIGVQSFDPDELKFLERVHSVDEVYSTIDLARSARFDNLSLDLIFALPGQSLERWQSHLETAIGQNPDHISTYNLTIEAGTAFHKLQSRGKLTMPEDDFQLEHYKKSIETLGQAGYAQYEISNFCQPGKECKHNLVYWENREYMGLGAGASSYLNGVRRKNCNLPAKYIREIDASGSAIEFEETLEAQKTMEETLMLGLRLIKGISIDQFETRFETSFAKLYGKVINSLLEKNLITLDKQRLALSSKGLFLADSVIIEFMA